MTSSPASRRDLISVVLSFRNEEAVLSEFLRRLTTVLVGLDAEYEIIFVNDDSTDRSLELLKHHAAADRNIRIINMSRAFGVAECLTAGLEHARGDAVVYLDCDLQDPPELIPHLVAEWRNGADVVCTVRTKRLNESRLKLFVTGAAYRVIDALSEISLPPEAGDFRLLSRRVVRELVRLPETDPYLRGLTRWVGFRQVFVPYERHPRKAGQGHFPLMRSTNPARSFISAVTSFSTVPVYVILVTGIVTSVLAVTAIGIAGVAVLAGFVAYRIAGVAFLMLLWGTLMAALGTIGVYVVRAYKDVRGRPRYIIADTFGFAGDEHAQEL